MHNQGRPGKNAGRKKAYKNKVLKN